MLYSHPGPGLAFISKLILHRGVEEFREGCASFPVATTSRSRETASPLLPATATDAVQSSELEKIADRWIIPGAAGRSQAQHGQRTAEDLERRDYLPVMNSCDADLRCRHRGFFSFL